MRDETKNSWEVRRRKAIKRLVEAWEEYGGEASDDDPEPVNRAADAVTVAHLASVLEWEGGPSTVWQEKEARTMERLVSTWRKHEEDQEDLEAAEQLNVALDELSIAHVAATFEWATGPLEWDNS